MTLTDTRKKVVFLGTPQVAAEALKILLSSQLIKIILVVSQPPSRSSRNGKETPSPTHTLALDAGIPVLTPDSAKNSEFLADLKELEPDLCITAAYGNFLPKDFLNIPKFGTLNIHPSLLPLYRGAAPVQRCIERGDKVTGVTILHTVLAMDAGPILAQEEYLLDNKIKAPELLMELFEKGAHLLLKSLPMLFLNQAHLKEQEHSKATKADKISPSEGILNFTESAETLHNKVRAFAGWPGTRATILLNHESVNIKVLTTSTQENSLKLAKGEFSFSQNALCICCGDGNILKILELQLPGKKALTAKEFQNGLQGKTIKLTS